MTPRTKSLIVGSLITLAVAMTTLSASAILILFTPEYPGCGRVSVNGYVSGSPSLPPTWDWGDGSTTAGWFPQTHRYSLNGTYTIVVSSGTDSDSATVTVTDAGDPTCSYRVLVSPPNVFLRDGTTTATLTIELRDSEGHDVPLTGHTVSYQSSRPDLVAVNSSGVVSSAGFGQASITVTVDGIGATGQASVYAGRAWLDPPVLYLSTSGGTSAAGVQAYAQNADGTPVTGAATYYYGGNSVASVDLNSGLVTALTPPVDFSDSPYISATINGNPTSNATFVRVTTDDLGLTPVEHTGQQVSVWTPDTVCEYPFGQLVDDLQATEVLDAAYEIMGWLTDVAPNGCDTQNLVCDPGVDADGTVPCGLSGNPVRLGTGVGNGRSCFGGDDWLQWGIMTHEMGHNFMSQQPFAEFCAALGDDAGTYIEGMASMLGIYALDQIANDPATYGISASTVDNLTQQWIPLTPEFSRSVFYDELTDYEAAPDYADFTADDLDAILTQLHDEFGSTFFYRLLSGFLPAHAGLSVTVATKAEALSYWAAVCSAAAETDLLARFVERWAFPLDETFYWSILPDVTVAVNQRSEPVPQEGSTSAVFRVGSAGDIRADGPFHGAHFLSGSADVAEWVPVSESAQAGDVLELDPQNPGHYRKARASSSGLVAGVVSAEPGVILGAEDSGFRNGLSASDSGLSTDDWRLPGAALAPLALVGIVPVKVCDEGGPIHVGDLLVVSSQPGIAMRWDGAKEAVCGLVGKALEESTRSTDVVRALLIH